MLELLASVGGGFLIGSVINCVREGVRFRPYHSKKARAEFKRKRNRKIRKVIISELWTLEDIKKGPKFYD